MKRKSSQKVSGGVMFTSVERNPFLIRTLTTDISIQINPYVNKALLAGITVTVLANLYRENGCGDIAAPKKYKDKRK